MNKIKRISLPLTNKMILTLNAGDMVNLTGTIYVVRDQSHRRIVNKISELENRNIPVNDTKLPFPLKNSIIYYCGPTPTPRGRIVGSCGPTTSSRMDEFTPVLLKYGLKGMIGKGARSREVIRQIKKFQAVYFITVGGTGALISSKVCRAELVAYPELGTEAIFKFEVNNFPVLVAIDSKGKVISNAFVY